MSTNRRSYDRRDPSEIIEASNRDAIQQLITRTRRLLRSTWTATGLALAGGVFISSLLLVTIVDLAIPLPRALRVVGWLVVFVSAGGAFVLGVVVPLLRRLTAVKIASRIESHLPGIHNRLVSCVELTDTSESAMRSPVFHRRLISEAIQRIRGFQPKQVLDLVVLRRAAMFAAGGLGAMIVAGLLFGDRMPTAVARIVNPLADIPPNSGVFYEVLIDDRTEPGDAEILRGEDVTFTVVLHQGKVDRPGGTDPLRLELMLADDEGGERRVRHDFGVLRDNRVSLTLNEMQTACSYRIRGGGTWSKRYSITLLDRPRITSLRGLVYFPEYMRIATPQISDKDDIDINGPIDSRVEIVAEIAGDASEGRIELLAAGSEGELVVVNAVPMTPDESGGKWRGSFDLRQDGFYRVVLRNSLGYANRRMKEGRLTAIPDGAPQVVLSRPTEDIVVTSPLEIPVQVAAFDDFGLDEISLIIEHNYWGQSRQVHNCSNDVPPRDEDVLFVLDLAKQRLRRDDRIECRVEARDTKGQVAVSKSFSVRVANQHEAADRQLVELREQLDSVEAMLDSLAREHRRADEIVTAIATAETRDPAEAVDGRMARHREGRFETETEDEPTDDDPWDRGERMPVRDDDDIWERDAELDKFARLTDQNADLGAQMAEALQQAATQAAEAQLLPTEIADQIAAAAQAIEPAVEQPLRQLQQMARQMSRPEAGRDPAESAQRVSDHLQDNLEDLQARLDAIQQAQANTGTDIEQALTDFEQQLAEQNAASAVRELEELSEFVDDLREDLARHHERQELLTARNEPRMSEPAFDALAARQEALEQRTDEDLNDASRLLNSNPIDDLGQEGGDRESALSGELEDDNPFELPDDGWANDHAGEEAVEPEPGHHDANGLGEDDGFEANAKDASFKPALDSFKKSGERPFGEQESDPMTDGREAGGHEEAAGERSESWEDVFGETPPPRESDDNDSGRPGRSAPSRSQPSSGEPSRHEPIENDPRARLARQQQQHAEQLSWAAESLASDQQSLGELIDQLSQAANAQQPAGSPSARQLGQLLNSAALQQALAMHGRMNEIQLPPSLSRNATAQLAQSRGNPEGARSMTGAVEQILVELGESDPNAASLLMRMQPHQREDLLQGLRQGGPAGYQHLIRDYFIRLSQANAR